MSTSCNQTPRRSDKLKELLYSMEKAHKADIQTYSSGHLAPNRLTHKPLYSRPLKPIWSKPIRKDIARSNIQQRSKTEVNMKETIENNLHSFAISTTLEEPGIQERVSEDLPPTGLRGVLHMTTLGKAKQESCTVSDLVKQDSCWFTDSHEAGLSLNDRLCLRQRFDPQVLRVKGLNTSLSGREVAKRHERILQKALRKLPASGNPYRERLTVFSDVFDDVCDGSPVFGSILREIKTEYDLYMRSLLSTQSPLQEKSAFGPFGVFTGATEVKEAARQVFKLEQDVRKAVEENDRVGTEYEDTQAKALLDQKEKWETKSCNTGQFAEDMFSGVKPCELSKTAQVEAKRQQVWKVWNEVQRLQKDIRETMVSTVITSALMNCIKDSEDEILNLAASNVILQRTNKDLEQNISVVLSKANFTEETNIQVWKEIWTMLNGHD